MGSIIRLHVAGRLEAGGRVALSREQAHYLLSVMRLRAGDALAVFNARDGEFGAALEQTGKREAALALGERLRPPPAPGPDLWLVFAPLKRHRTELVLEKAVELGCARILPVITRHTDRVSWKTDRVEARLLEAAEQCERLDIPGTAEPETLEALLEAWPRERRLWLLAERGERPDFASALEKTPPGPAGILVGPEGGFAEAELEMLAGRDFVSAVSLGPRILRAETAAIAGLSLWQARHGDWREGAR
jgi:16S rRNA (uracil1498-N3)-methyltransferase